MLSSEDSDVILVNLLIGDEKSTTMIGKLKGVLIRGGLSKMQDHVICYT